MVGNDMFRALEITGTALTAERTRMDVIAQNLANANVTRMADGSGPYRRKEVVFAQDAVPEGPMPAFDRTLGLGMTWRTARQISVIPAIERGPGNAQLG